MENRKMIYASDENNTDWVTLGKILEYLPKQYVIIKYYRIDQEINETVSTIFEGMTTEIPKPFLNFGMIEFGTDYTEECMFFSVTAE